MTIGEPCRVMIVDDETLIRQGIKHYFNWEEEGFLIVGEAANGQEALEIIEEIQPHILITDIVMPIMDGEELTKIVKGKYPYIEIVVLSSFGEFEYVRSSFQNGVVDYILKPKLNAENLLAVLRMAAKRIPHLQLSKKSEGVALSVDQLLDKLIAGFEIDENIEAIKMLFPQEAYLLVGITIGQKSSKEQGVKDLAQSFFSEKLNHIYYHIRSEKKTDVFLLNINKANYARIVASLDGFSDKQPDYRFLVTEMFDQITEVGKVYKESLLQLMDYRFYFPEKKLVLQTEILPASKPSVHFNLELLTEEIKRERFASAFQYVREHGKHLSTCFTVDVQEFKSSFNNIIFTITILLRNIGYDVKQLEIDKYSHMALIEEASDAREVLRLLDLFLDKALNCVEGQQLNNRDRNMKELLDYISEHYMEPITLTSVAKHFHFNPSYLSSYFTSHNKEGFNEYVNKIRIEAATQKLRTSSASISEISAQVGYADHSYFCKVFKKMTGYSPSQYRRKQLK